MKRDNGIMLPERTEPGPERDKVIKEAEEKYLRVKEEKKITGGEK